MPSRMLRLSALAVLVGTIALVSTGTVAGARQAHVEKLFSLAYDWLLGVVTHPNLKLPRFATFRAKLPTSASRRRTITDTPGIGDGTPTRPRSARTRSEEHDLMAATI